ncbi:MAG: VCBS repeat-containing protein, partial [Planctomycetota bacterium]
MFAAPLAALLLFAPVSDADPADAGSAALRNWPTLTLTDTFYAEGAYSGDLDNDGQVDLVVGPIVYFGPDWIRRRTIHGAGPVSPLTYSDEFLTFTADLTDDGFPDVISIGWPGKESRWHENPGLADADGEAGRDRRTDGQWKTHLLAPVVDNESPMVADFLGDERVELIAQLGGSYGYFTPRDDPYRPWVFHPVSEPKKELGRYTHGLGVGDVDGDGRKDLLHKDGWLRQPESLEGDPLWEPHDYKFADKASQMFAFDVDGDGDNDVVCCDNAHGYGLNWFEQTPASSAGADSDGGGGIAWVKHVIMGGPENNPAVNAAGDPVLFTQPHAVAAVDINGDGLTDLVTGKRFWAHGPKGDADPGG